MKKKIFKLFSLLLVLAITISVVLPLGNVNVQAKKKVKISKKELTLTTGQQKKLKLKNGTFEKEDITWTSSNKAVAKVSKSGKVTALLKGDCTITATVNETGKTYECHVSVEVPDPSERVIDPTKKIIALSFDDGPSQYTEGLIETLNSYGVTATFFMCNDNCGTNLIPKYQDLIRKMYNSGMEIANHTMKHPQLTKLSSSGMKDEIGGNRAKIEGVIGEQERVLLRPPYGSYNDTVKSVCEAPIILWSVDTLDWKVSGQSNATDQIMSELKKQAKDGYIILMHDIHKTSCEAVKTVIPWLISEGYQICSVSEMFEARGVELEDGVVYSKCITAEQYIKENG